MTLTTGGIKVYYHIQSAANSTWTITHNLGGKVIAEFWAMDGSVLKKAFPLSVIHQDDNQMVVTWSAAKEGRATLLRDINP